MRGLLDYLLASTDQKGDTRPLVEIIGGTFAGRTARTIAQEFAALRALRPNLGVAVVHETLRLPPTATEPTDAEWLSIARYWATKMGIDAWVAVVHGDGHIHIAGSRIRIDGSVVSDSHDWTLSERIVREIEKRFGLEQIKSSHLLEPSQDWIGQKAPRQEQLAVADRTGVPLPSELLAASINALLSKPISATAFVLGLEKAGFAVRPNIASTNLVSGLAYSIAGVVITARALGREYTWKSLQSRGLNFDMDRDLPTLFAARERSLPSISATSTAVGAAQDVESVENIVLPSLRAAQVFASVAVSTFIEAAGTDQFMVFHEPRITSGPGFVDVGDLMRPSMLQHILDGARFSSAIRAETLDNRIVVVTELDHEQVNALHAQGLQPFGIVEISPNVFEASIRLAPASDPEPSLEVRKMAARIVAEKVGGKVSETMHLPGFFSSMKSGSRKRRSLVVLHKATKVVAELGAALLASAREMLKKIARKHGLIKRAGGLLRPGIAATSPQTRAAGCGVVIPPTQPVVISPAQDDDSLELTSTAELAPSVDDDPSP
ncbi:hypothetical protein WH91_11250 [Devosia psychrophila]|uniref:MobA/VirD2-like nuclease domain-containing protein n=2 Tax=Devosia psychrophila TaxID=728005 RepID=A0A0F5PW95_9HYPH|nr:hypothetical protein WH91_11250 [Devosia psychrophila]SFD05382.1 hypothetical protein SAMN04488059_1196 [Devosia psychrophila]